MNENDMNTDSPGECDSQHPASCDCWRCYSQEMGTFIDKLGSLTEVGHWQLFVTQSYRTPSYPWAKGFPRRSEPHPDFVHHFAEYMMSWLAREFCAPVEFFFADQYGEASGRLHQHFGIASLGLSDAYTRLVALHSAGNTARLPEDLKPFQRMLWDRAGFNRILPWLHPASFYIGRYIGRDTSRCYWQWSVGEEQSTPSVAADYPIGRTVVAHSAELPAEHFRGGVLRRWHR